MKKQIIFLSLLTLMTTFVSPPAFTLETLTASQMKRVVAQAGVDIAIDNVLTETHFEHITLSETAPDSSTDYMALNTIHILNTVNTGLSDESGNGFINHLTLDVGSYYYDNTNHVMLFVESPDLSIVSDITVDNINFCGQNIGNLQINDFELSSFHLYAGPHDATGIDFELGIQTRTESLIYQYGSTEALSLKLSGICFAESFDNSTAIGEFRIGDLDNKRPASFDIASDPERVNNTYLVMNLPMEGSFHIDNITFGVNASGVANDFGSLTVDGLRAEKLYIEFPGRGLGLGKP